MTCKYFKEKNDKTEYYFKTPQKNCGVCDNFNDEIEKCNIEKKIKNQVDS